MLETFFASTVQILNVFHYENMLLQTLSSFVSGGVEGQYNWVSLTEECHHL